MITCDGWRILGGKSFIKERMEESVKEIINGMCI